MNNRRLYLAEFAAAFVLVFVSCGAVCLRLASHNRLAAVGVSVEAGIAAAAMIFVFALISSRHIMAASRTGERAERGFPVRRLLAYIGCQLAGAWVAGVLLTAIFPAVARSGLRIVEGPWVWSFVIEVAVVAVIMMVLMGLATDNRALVQAEALAMSGGIIALAMVVGPKSGGWINPARPLGPALANEVTHSLWLYAMGPLLGAAVGAGVYRLVKYVQDRPAPIPKPKPKPKPKPVPPPPPPEPPKPPQPLPAPGGLAADSPTKQPILTWLAVDGAVRYVIYRDDAQLASPATCTYTDDTVDDGRHEYYVSAVDGQETAGTASAHAAVVVDRTGPQIGILGPFSNELHAPFTLKVTASDALTGVTEGEYFVGETDPGVGSAIALVLADGLLVTASSDTTLADLPVGTHRVCVRAQDGIGNWTNPSVTAQLTVKAPVPAPQAEAPLPVPGRVTAASPTRSGAFLNWAAVPGATGYEVWKRNSKTLATTQAGTSTTTNFSDQYEPGIFNYFVVATNGDRKSGRSTPVPVTVIDNSSQEVQEFMAITRPETIPKVNSIQK